MKGMSDMAGVLLRKTVGLGRDESGVAFVVTLAMVLPLLILVTLSAGVSDMARRKVRLQNSADMAARSAAVVQADLLSKMAVVNRVTAWTYANYCRRRMDWLMGKFCERCMSEWQRKQIECALMANTRGLPFPNVTRSNYGVGKSLTPFAAQEQTGVALFNPMAFRSILNMPYQTPVSVRMALAGAGESSTAALHLQIVQDHAILEGTKATWERLRADYKKEVKKAAEDILKANFLKKNGKSWGDYYWKIDFNTDVDKVFKKLGSGESDERALFEMAWLDPYAKTSYAGKDVLGAGADTWFVRDERADHPKRVYRENKKFLQAQFDWAWYAWGKLTPFPVDIIGLRPKVKGVNMNNGTVTVKASEIPEVTRTRNGIVYADAPVTAYTLKDSFFSKEGAITVAAMWDLPNPFGKLAGGSDTAPANSMWSTLNPTVGKSHRPSRAMAIASARAGYKRAKRGQSHRERVDSTRYTLHPMNDVGALRWNLCETDWEGMLIPVVAARSQWRSEAMQVKATPNILPVLFEDPVWKKNGLLPWNFSAENLMLRSPRMGGSSRTGLLNRLTWLKLGKLVLH